MAFNTSGIHSFSGQPVDSKQKGIRSNTSEKAKANYPQKEVLSIPILKRNKHSYIKEMSADPQMAETTTGPRLQ